MIAQLDVLQLVTVKAITIHATLQLSGCPYPQFIALNLDECYVSLWLRKQIGIFYILSKSMLFFRLMSKTIWAYIPDECLFEFPPFSDQRIHIYQINYLHALYVFQEFFRLLIFFDIFFSKRSIRNMSECQAVWFQTRPDVCGDGSAFKLFAKVINKDDTSR